MIECFKDCLFYFFDSAEDEEAVSQGICNRIYKVYDSTLQSIPVAKASQSYVEESPEEPSEVYIVRKWEEVRPFRLESSISPLSFPPECRSREDDRVKFTIYSPLPDEW